MKLPIYDITINMDDTDTGMCCCSLVEDAAVSVDFLAFNKETEDKQHQLLQFKNDGTEHKIFGCAIRCGFPIYRIDNFGREFYVRFGKEVIEQIILKYSKEGLHNLVSLNHDGNLVSGITLVEMFIKNTEKGISPLGFEDIEDGSLFVTYKVEDDNIWNEIVNKNVKGFSIEIISDIVPTNETIEDGFSKQEQPIDEMESFIDDLMKYLNGEDLGDEIEILFADSKKKIESVIEEAIDNDTKVNIKVDGKSKVLQGFIYSTNENILSLYDNEKDTWHLVQKNTIKTVNTVKSNVIVNWDKAFANPDFQKILDIVREQPSDKTATVGNDIIEDAIINKKVVMVKYDDETTFNCKTYRQGYILTKIINRKGNLCLRFFENSGATHSNEDNPLPSWRTLRIDRLVDIKFAPNVFTPLTVPPNGWNPTESVERDGAVVLLKSKF